MKLKLIFAILLTSLCITSCAHNKSEANVSKLTFNNENEARSYVATLVLTIQKIYERSTEPYSGGSESLPCKSAIETSGKYVALNGGQYVKMVVELNSSDVVIKCGMDDHALAGVREFFICGKDVFVKKSFFKQGSEASDFKCPDYSSKIETVR
ncbi:MAG: hypothetical protein H7177_00445 [Rhizobacter sp.]|nr:hypothetical protein [Bacteriovorax sp.]